MFRLLQNAAIAPGAQIFRYTALGELQFCSLGRCHGQAPYDLSSFFLTRSTEAGTELQEFHSTCHMAYLAAENVMRNADSDPKSLKEKLDRIYICVRAKLYTLSMIQY